VPDIPDSTPDAPSPSRDFIRPGAHVEWRESLGPRRNMRRNRFAGMARGVPALVVSVGAAEVEIRAGGRTLRVDPRELREGVR
jgi:hypothetical protein